MGLQTWVIFALRDRLGRVLHETITAAGGTEGVTPWPPGLNDNYQLEVTDLITGIPHGITVGAVRPRDRKSVV